MTFDDSFDGVAFRILREGRTEARDALVTVRKIPGGSVTYLDRGGALPRTRTYRVHLPSYAAFDNLDAKVGNTGTLVDTLRGTRTAVLHRLEFEDDAADGSVVATAEWTLL